MKNTKFLRIAALLIAVIMMMSLCLVSCNDGENAETTTAESTPAVTTPADTTVQNGGEMANPDADVSTAAGVAALLNANLAGKIPTVPESGEQGGEQGGIGNIGNIGDIMGDIDLSTIDAKTIVGELIKSMEGSTTIISNLSGSLVADKDLPKNFQLSGNFLYMFDDDVNDTEKRAIGKLSADGFSLVANNNGGIEAMTPIAFTELYAELDAALASLSDSLGTMPEVELDVDMEAIKAALTVKEDDLIDLGNGVWQLKSTYVVNAIKTVLGELGVTEAEIGEAQDIFNLILITNMTADLSKYAQTGELTIKLDIPMLFTAEIYSSATAYNVDVVAGTMKASLHSTENEGGGEITLNVTELGKEVVAATFVVTDNGNKMALSAVANVTAEDEAGNVSTFKYDINGKLSLTDTGLASEFTVKCNDAVILECETTLSSSASGMQFSATIEDKQNNLNASFAANIGATMNESTAELHVTTNDQGVESKIDLVINTADANGEIVKASVTANGATTFSFIAKAVGADDNGPFRLNIALVTADGDLSFDVFVPTVTASEPTDAEKAGLALCDNFLANYATYVAQLAEYNAQVEAAVLAGKPLPGDFALIDKTNPNVVYRYHVFVYSANDYEISGNIEFALDTTGYNVITEADLAV